MRHWDCPYECSDDDCYKCAKHGYQFSCDGCEDYEKFKEEEKQSHLKKGKNNE